MITRDGCYYLLHLPVLFGDTTVVGVLIQISGRTQIGKCVAQLLMVVAVHLKNAFMQKGRRFSRTQDKIVFLRVAL